MPARGVPPCARAAAVSVASSSWTMRVCMNVRALLGFKSAPAIDDVLVDPDVQERVPTTEELARGRAFLARWFPALKDQPLIESRVCQYENSVDSEFFVSVHPTFENVWLVGGGSGHGFKHGIMLGEYVARRIVGASTNPDWDAFFALKEKTF